jgi:hypothetical protein
MRGVIPIIILLLTAGGVAHADDKFERPYNSSTMSMLMGSGTGGSGLDMTIHADFGRTWRRRWTAMIEGDAGSFVRAGGLLRFDYIAPTFVGGNAFMSMFIEGGVGREFAVSVNDPPSRDDTVVGIGWRFLSDMDGGKFGMIIDVRAVFADHVGPMTIAACTGPCSPQSRMDVGWQVITGLTLGL